MKTIPFKWGNLYDMMDEHEDDFCDLDRNITEKQDENVLDVMSYRIVIPALHVSLRCADWYCFRDLEEDDYGDKDDYLDAAIQCSVFVEYEENETDINEYVSFIDDRGIEYEIADWCKKNGLSADDRDNLECYVEFD